MLLCNEKYKFRSGQLESGCRMQPAQHSDGMCMDSHLGAQPFSHVLYFYNLVIQNRKHSNEMSVRWPYAPERPVSVCWFIPSLHWQLCSQYIQFIYVSSEAMNLSFAFIRGETQYTFAMRYYIFLFLSGGQSMRCCAQSMNSWLIESRAWRSKGETNGLNSRISFEGHFIWFYWQELVRLMKQNYLFSVGGCHSLFTHLYYIFRIEIDMNVVRKTRE